MTLFLYVVLGLFALDLLGKLVTLYRRDTYRPLWTVAVDAAANTALLVWGAFVLGGK